MSSCGSSNQPANETVRFYSLTPFFAHRTPPADFAELAKWLMRNDREKHWDGKFYVARTIKWNSRDREFRQEGCSPNYHSALWSLACCKHKMRSARPRDKVDEMSVPTYIFTLSSKANDESIQALVSVAEISIGLKTMKDYADHLLTKNKSLISSRFTRERCDDGLLGWRFGDCHSDSEGNIGQPDSGHVHFPDDWRQDKDGKHEILLAERFVVWRDPVFIARDTIKQSAFGGNISEKNLDRVLREYAPPKTRARENISS